MKRLIPALTTVVVLLAAAPFAWTHFKKADTGEHMAAAAQTLLRSFNEKQRAAAQMEFASEIRTDWHFIPKKTRKGVQLRDMSGEQREHTHGLLRACLSKVGYFKADKIMEIEGLLALLEGEGSRFKRDPLKYYVTVFGDPKESGRWGLSFEGHHLSLNFVVDDGEVVSSTPQFFGCNPAVVKKDYEGSDFDKGTRILGDEETLAFELVNSLKKKQLEKALLDPQAPREIRAAGEAQPPQTEPAGIPSSELKKAQQKLLRELVDTYINSMPYEVAQKRNQEIRAAGFDKVHFAWAGARKPGIGHYYRIQGPTFLVELVNTQPDAAGNPANHVHAIWRSMRGDFGLPIEED